MWFWFIVFYSDHLLNCDSIFLADASFLISASNNDLSMEGGAVMLAKALCSHNNLTQIQIRYFLISIFLLLFLPFFPPMNNICINIICKSKREIKVWIVQLTSVSSFQSHEGKDQVILQFNPEKR